MLNTLHTVCFVHGLSIYEIKMMVTVLIFSEPHMEVSAFDQCSKNKKNDNTSPKYRAKTVVIFSQLLSFNFNYWP